MIEVRLCERTCAAYVPAASVHVNGLSSSQGDGFSVYFYNYYVQCTLNYLGTPRDCIFSLLIHFFVFFIIKGNGDTVLKLPKVSFCTCALAKS